jgi:orotate phosphoribosyltransferase
MAYGGVKLGSFMLRSGITSPIYLGLHALISDMCLYSSIASLLHTLPVMRPYGRFFGIPYSGLPIAVVLFVDHTLRMLCAARRSRPQVNLPLFVSSTPRWTLSLYRSLSFPCRSSWV